MLFRNRWRVFEKHSITLRVGCNETGIGSPKKQRPPQVIVARDTSPGTTTLAAMRNDAQLTLFTGHLGDSIPPLIMSENQTYEQHLLAEHQLYEWHDYVIRNAAKTTITEVLSVEWLKMMFLPRIENIRANANYTSLVVLIPDSHSRNMTGRMVAFAGSKRILIIRLIPHSFHLSQLLDLSAFGLFKVWYMKEPKTRKLKGETLKIDRTLHSLSKARVIFMVRWSLRRAEFHSNADILLASLAINRPEVWL
jgi:hypothetical protein